MMFERLPAGWTVARMTDIAAKQQHALSIGPFGSDLKTSDYRDSGVPIVFVRDVQPNGFRPKSRQYVSASKARQLAAHAVQPGDLVVTKMGLPPCVAAVYPLTESPGIVTADIIKMSVDENIADRMYVAQFLNSELAKGQVAAITFGNTRPKVTLRDFKEIRLPLPPLAEQRRIAEVLDRTEALLTKRRAAVIMLNEFIVVSFSRLFGDLVANELGWPSASVSDFVAGFQSGKNVVADDEGAAAEYRVLKVSAVTSLEYVPGASKAAPIGYKPPKSHIVRSGDLLFSRANTAELIGATAYVFDTPSNVLLPDKIWRFVWREPEVVDPLFVWFLFRQASFRREVSKLSTGSSGSMKNIAQDKVLGIRVGLPPLSLQREFAQIVRTVYRVRAAHGDSLRGFEKLFASLQQRAFRGEL